MGTHVVNSLHRYLQNDEEQQEEEIKRDGPGMREYICYFHHKIAQLSTFSC